MFLQSFDKSFVLLILNLTFSPIFYRQNRGESKLTRGSSQGNLTLIETETRVQAYFATPFLNFKMEDFYRLQLYTQNCKICQQPCMFFWSNDLGNKVVFFWPSMDLTQCYYNLLTSPLFYPFLRCLYMLSTNNPAIIGGILMIRGQ
jgi:hypothetical protein